MLGICYIVVISDVLMSAATQPSFATAAGNQNCAPPDKLPDRPWSARGPSAVPPANSPSVSTISNSVASGTGSYPSLTWEIRPTLQSLTKSGKFPQKCHFVPHNCVNIVEIVKMGEQIDPQFKPQRPRISHPAVAKRITMTNVESMANSLKNRLLSHFVLLPSRQFPPQLLWLDRCD